MKKGAEAREHFTKVEEIKREIGKIGEEVEILGFDDSDDSDESAAKDKPEQKKKKGNHGNNENDSLF